MNKQGVAVLNNHISLSKLQIYLLIIYLLPLALILWFIASFSVNVPVGDQFALISFFDKIATGNVNFKDFFYQHNEHRIFFPRIIFLILAFTSNWQIKIELYFSLFLAIFNFCAIYKIAAISQKERNILFHSFNILTCVLTFSLVQNENWLWGFQVSWFLINTCVILSVLLLSLTNTWSTSIKLTLAALCCFIASFSSAHGLFSWLAVIPSVASVEGNTKSSKIRLLLWISFFIISCAFYSIGYHKPGHHPDTLFFFKEPLAAISYLLTIIGTPVGKLFLPRMISGLIILFSFIFFNVYYIYNYKSKFAYDLAPWLSIGWFASFFALITTVGRAGFGIEQASSSRYTTVMILLIISCLQMWRLLIYHRQEWFSKNNYLRLGSYLLVGILAVNFITGSTSAIANGRATWLDRSRGKTCLEIIHFFNKSISESPDNCLKFIFPDPALVISSAETLQKLGFRHFPRDIAFIAEPTKIHGYVDISPKTDQLLTLSRNGSVTLAGWAILPDSSQQPNLVLLSHGNNQSFFASAVVNIDSSDVANNLKSNRYKKSGWQANIYPKSIPLGETVIKAWVYNQEQKQFVKLSGESKIKVVE
ncbi:MAG: hypothetical protein F6K36_18605 [Symploca sp. SIO3C6]|uniref:YfhO family protein n=1 Tax=Symploca sp. SIO1C4 TaxID=2607765 RepID=A0A6B3N6C7_9CYAN|nr:hypothetical protein [Symploca sp. SIO3C6]NER27150.1 hypothetical protein [Symploca sp. SIO1C4]